MVCPDTYYFTKIILLIFLNKFFKPEIARDVSNGDFVIST